MVRVTVQEEVDRSAATAAELAIAQQAALQQELYNARASATTAQESAAAEADSRAKALAVCEALRSQLLELSVWPLRT